ncbi:7278_t:CDS:1, partial [Ambispora leptoticha]
FLALLSPECLRQCIDTLGAFGLQMDDLNISLTAVGLLWNVSDFIQTKRAELEKNNSQASKHEDTPNIDEEIDQMIGSTLTVRTTNALWLLLLLQLSKICSDPRPEVRNGANQTLFRTIDMNGAVLGINTWNTCIWKVLFPLLDSVNLASSRALKAMQQHGTEMEKINLQQESRGFMVHHSRNTVDKQWDETKVLVLNGVSGIFKNFLSILVNLENFPQAWDLLLSHLRDSCLHSSHEVAIASIKALHTMIQFPNDSDQSLSEKISPLWQTTWIMWEKIGLGIITGFDNTHLPGSTGTIPTDTATPNDQNVSRFSQDTLTAYISSFTDLYKFISTNFKLDETKRLLKVARGILVYSKSPSYRPDQDYPTPLQESILDLVSKIDLNVKGAPAAVLNDLADYITLAFKKFDHLSQQMNYEEAEAHSQPPPLPPKNEGSSSSSKSFSTVTFIAFSKT